MPLSPIQKSAGVKSILEASGFLRRSGVYAAGQPNTSPFQGLPVACRWRANWFTSARWASLIASIVLRVSRQKRRHNRVHAFHCNTLALIDAQPVAAGNNVEQWALV